MRRGSEISKWIRVKDKVPEHDQVVLAYGYELDNDDDHCIIKARFSRPDRRRKGWFDSGEFEDIPDVYAFGEKITHWMPLPDPPETVVAGSGVDGYEPIRGVVK
jgi:hypothetical protein